jgi:hypothetical protein
LSDRGGSGRPSCWTPQLRAVLAQSLAQPPDHWGYQAVDWTVPLLSGPSHKFLYVLVVPVQLLAGVWL